MPFFVQVDENLEIQNNYESEFTRRVGDIELLERINLSTIDVIRGENGEIEFQSNVVKQELMMKHEFDYMRSKRNFLLDQSDKYMTVDYPHPTPEKKQEWLDYRQALRDIPPATEDPTNPAWPSIPTA